MVAPSFQIYDNWHGNTYEEGLVFRGQPRPYPKVAGPQHYPLLGFPSNYASLCRRSTQFDVVTRGAGGVLWSATLPTQESVPIYSYSLPNFGGSHVFMPTLFNAERANLKKKKISRTMRAFAKLCLLLLYMAVQHGNTWGGACFRSATLLHLQKSVARFVSDSCVSCFDINDFVFQVSKINIESWANYQTRFSSWLMFFVRQLKVHLQYFPAATTVTISSTPREGLARLS